MDVDKLIAGLERIVSAQYLSTSLFEKIKNCTTPRPLEVEEKILPYVVVMPETSDEISAVMKLANEMGVPVFVRGSGTSLTAQSRPHTAGIMLNTHRMRKIEIFEDYGYLECGPGIRAAAVAEKLTPLDCFLPVWPGSLVVASMGGLVCNNTSGHIVDACFGKPADYIMGLEVVLPTGEIIETGTKGMRRIAGTDLTKFFVGSDGIMGVVTNIRMRLVPQFKQAYGIAVFDDLADMARGVQKIYQKRLPAPLFMEMMNTDVAKIGYEIKNMTPPTGPVLMFSQISYDKDVAVKKVNAVLSVLSETKAVSAEAIEDPAAWQTIVATREVIGPYLMQKNDGIINSAEVVSNLHDLGDAMTESINFNQGLPMLGQLQNYLYGHIGALTFHPSFIFPRSWTGEDKKAALKELFEQETRLNLKYGTAGGEWGQFAPRTSFFIQKFGADGYSLVKKFKQLVDPGNILNPGILEGYR